MDLLSFPRTTVVRFFRCFLISFNLGFAMLSGWISIAADIIYARQFTQRNPRSSHHTTGVLVLDPLMCKQTNLVFQRTVE